VSVIIPCYNQAVFLKETCESVVSQTYINWEVLIINDGSTDLTESVAKEICDKDKRFKYYYKENGGLSSARNLGLDNASGDYIQFLDSDDLLEPNKFKKSLEKQSDLMITNFMMLNKKKRAPFCQLEGNEFSYKNVLLDWDVKFSIPIHCGLFSTKILGDIRFSQDLKAKEDWFFWLSFLKKKPRVLFINEPLVLYRLHNSNMCKDNSHMEENSKAVYRFIYSTLSEKFKELFFNKVAVNFVEERSKSEYYYKRYRKEKKRKNSVIVLYSVFLVLLIIVLIYVVTVK